MTTTVVGVFVLLFFIAPGLLFQVLQERRRPVSSGSGFRETTRVLLFGVIFSCAALAVAAVTRAILPDIMPDPGLWLEDPREYLVDEYRLVSRFLAGQLILSLCLAFLAHIILSRSWDSRIQSVSAWFKVFRTDRPPHTIPRLRVKLDDGAVFVGSLHHYTATPDELAEREIVLGPPIWVKSRPDDDLMRLPHEWQRLVLPGNQVRSMAVSYVPHSVDLKSGGAFRRLFGALGRWKTRRRHR